MEYTSTSSITQKDTELEYFPVDLSDDVVAQTGIAHGSVNGQGQTLWRVVIEDTHAIYHLYHVHFASNASRSTVMEQLHALAKAHGHTWKLFFLFKTPIVEIAEVAASLDTDPEALSFPLKVALNAHTPSPLLTTAYLEPSHLSNSNAFIQAYPQFVVTNTNHETTKTALLVGLNVSKPLVAGFLAVWLVIAVAVGLLVGLLKGLDTGLQVGGAVVAVVAVVEAGLFWVFK